jgi:hypothetical protein
MPQPPGATGNLLAAVSGIDQSTNPDNQWRIERHLDSSARCGDRRCHRFHAHKCRHRAFVDCRRVLGHSGPTLDTARIRQGGSARTKPPRQLTEGLWKRQFPFCCHRRSTHKGFSVASRELGVADELRIFPVAFPEGVDLNDFPGSRPIWTRRTEVVYSNTSPATRATWSPPGPVAFNTPIIKMLQPLAEMGIQTLDALADEMLDRSVLVTDLRKCIGRVDDLERARELLFDSTLESFREAHIAIKRRPDGGHGDLWQLGGDTVRALKSAGMLKSMRDIKYGSAARKVFILKDGGLDGKSGERYFRDLAPGFEGNPVVATDHFGEPITERDIALEINRMVPQGMPPDLVPDAPANCSDKEWDRLMLIEQIKFRRSVDAKRSVKAG